MREDFDRFLQRLQAFWRSFCNSQNRVRLLVAVGLLGMGLILCSELLAGEEPKKSEPAMKQPEQQNVQQSEQQLQQRLEEIISQIDGVGECSVMLTFEESERSVYAVEDSVSQEQDRQTNSGSSTSQKRLVLVENGEGGNQPVLEKTVRPQVNGVVVVCQGAKSMTVCQQVTDYLAELFATGLLNEDQVTRTANLMSAINDI